MKRVVVDFICHGTCLDESDRVARLALVRKSAGEVLVLLGARGQLGQPSRDQRGLVHALFVNQ